MLFVYDNLVEFVANKSIPSRLLIENRGGLRIIDSRFFSFFEKIIDFVSGHMHNLILVHKGDFKSILNQVNAEMEKVKFVELFDMDQLKTSITEYLNKRDVGDEKSREQKDNTGDASSSEIPTNLKVDLKVLQESLKRVKRDAAKGVVTRALWSHIKKMSPAKKSTISLRSKLQLFHMSTDSKYSSLQANS